MAVAAGYGVCLFSPWSRPLGLRISAVSRGAFAYGFGKLQCCEGCARAFSHVRFLKV